MQRSDLPAPASRPPNIGARKTPRQSRLTPLSCLYCLEHIILPEKNNVKDAPVEKTAILLVFITAKDAYLAPVFSEDAEIPGCFFSFSR